VIKRLYEKITGTPWTTGRSASVDFGPTIAARYPELVTLTDTQLMNLTPTKAIAYAQARRENTGEAWMNFIETHLYPHVLADDTDAGANPSRRRPRAHAAIQGSHRPIASSVKPVPANAR